MTPNLELAIRVVVFLVMVTVGLDLRWRDFARVRDHPKLVLGVVAGQWIALVVIAGLIGRWLALPAEARTGMLLIAAAPAAALSCFYAQLARGDVALATTVAAVSTVSSAVVTPLAAEIGFVLFLDSQRQFEIALPALVQQTLAGLLLPLLIGMLVAQRFAGRVRGWQAAMRALGLVATMGLLAVIVGSELTAITAQLGRPLLGAATFTVAMLAVGACAAQIGASGAGVRRAVPWSFPARNIAVAVLLATNVEDKSAVAAFLSVLFVTQLALLVSLSWWARAARGGEPVSGGAC